MKKSMMSLIIAMFLLLTTALTAFAAEPQKQPEPATTEEPSTAFQVYFSGIDNRGPLIEYSRTDANVIITVNTETKQILLVHIPRDFNVEYQEGYKNKLTDNGVNGIESVLWSVNKLFDTEMKYYLRFNFQGFIDFIDAMGGVDVESEYDFTAYSGDQFVKGLNHLNGAQALAFARERKSFAVGDRQRGRDQMILMRSVIDKFSAGPELEDYPAFLEATKECFETNLPKEYIIKLLQTQLDLWKEQEKEEQKQQAGQKTQQTSQAQAEQEERKATDWNVVIYSVNGSDAYNSWGAYVMEPDMETVEHAKELMQRVLDGEVLDQEVDAPNPYAMD